MSKGGEPGSSRKPQPPPPVQLPPWPPSMCSTWEAVVQELTDLHTGNPSLTVLYHLLPIHLFHSSGTAQATRVHNWLRICYWSFDHEFNPPAHGRVQLMASQWRVALKGRYYRFPYVHAQPKNSTREISRLPPLLNAKEDGCTEKDGEQLAEGCKVKIVKQRSWLRIGDHIDVTVLMNMHREFVPYNEGLVCPSWGMKHISRLVVEGAEGLWVQVVWELSMVSFHLEFLHVDRAIAADQYISEEDIPMCK
ncbi:hypothetical protein WOLCODRAFT_156881 [Wolfiporia cocos MD-104 SS10]|uniref:Uncharacterized protein n=1 Tax=Wolfiporia cocos (strain MD-104) TaxID=742152 RepID=A0A2H3J372_WOLCO|nr:hypothetical protein WOLCODRAFT_156881 [Wolfiporia cocos MD-104 SS10]